MATSKNIYLNVGNHRTEEIYAFPWQLIADSNKNGISMTLHNAINNTFFSDVNIAFLYILIVISTRIFNKKVFFDLIIDIVTHVQIVG